ncbi:MAG: hypothetical protein RMJ56_15520 [Gemmataceae bacterium]|nr:hypothetical protein [Gemmata sp.]MDW8199006.1 hypothetical protein [Gemmataceae bacterium]
MAADVFTPTAARTPVDAQPDVAFIARPRLLALREELRRAAAQRHRSRWQEPPLFFFDPQRQAELVAAGDRMPPWAELAAHIDAAMPELFRHVEVRRLARALDLAAAAQLLAGCCPAARRLVDLLAVPDDEVFLVLDPLRRSGVRWLLRGAADVGQLIERLAVDFTRDIQLYTPAALRPQGTLPSGFRGCREWLWPTQPLAAVPRINGVRVVLVGPAVIRPATPRTPRFPELMVQATALGRLTPWQVADELTRLGAPAVTVPQPVAVMAPAA